MTVNQMLAELGVDSVEDALVELELAKDALEHGNTEPALPWEDSIEQAMQRIDADLQALVDATISQDALSIELDDSDYRDAA